MIAFHLKQSENLYSKKFVTIYSAIAYNIISREIGGSLMRRRHNNRERCCNTGKYIAAFGAGLIVASWFPSNFIIVVTAIALIILGLAMC